MRSSTGRPKRWKGWLVAAWLALAWPIMAGAHSASDAYLMLEGDGGTGSLRWDIALRDLAAALPIDTDGDGAIRWAELKRALPAILARARAGLQLDDGRCALALGVAGIERRRDGGYLSLDGRWDCPVAPASLRYALFAELDPTHRGLLRWRQGGTTVSASLAPDGEAFSLSAPRSQSMFAAGVHHILIGYDHVLFLLCLLFPAVLRRQDGSWRPVAGPAELAWPVLGVVTAFTLGHSLTLALATLGVLRLPAQVVEPAIAVSIALVAVGNLRGWSVTCNKIYNFAFGLVHGFGFAGVLSELGLPGGDFALALLQFNLGVEAGQLLVVVLALCLLYALRGWRPYARLVMPGASMLAIVVAAIWFAERVFDLRLIS